MRIIRTGIKEKLGELDSALWTQAQTEEDCHTQTKEEA